MLYKIGKTGDKFDSIGPLPFSGLPLEKDLENLIAQNLWDVLFESSELMPISQEHPWQPEADIYALNKEGDVIIFELKRDQVGSDAVHQALRYCEKAARFTCNELEEMFTKYEGADRSNLREEHRVAFELEHPLDRIGPARPIQTTSPQARCCQNAHHTPASLGTPCLRFLRRKATGPHGNSAPKIDELNGALFWGCSEDRKPNL
jgi:hypothetical protein